MFWVKTNMEKDTYYKRWYKKFGKEYNRKYRLLHKDKIYQNWLKWLSNNSEYFKKYNQSPEHKNKMIARRLLNNKVSRKNVVRGYCEVCGNNKAEAHHEDYLKPLEVTWLCKKHHVEKHKNKN